MASHNALEVVVLPVLRGVGIAFALLAIARLSLMGLARLAALGKPRPTQAAVATPRPVAPAPVDRVAGLTR